MGPVGPVVDANAAARAEIDELVGRTSVDPLSGVVDGPLDEQTEVVTGADGSRSLRAYPSRKWFKAPNGRWAVVDPRLVAASDGEGFVSVGDKHSFEFGSTLEGVTVRSAEGEVLRFRPDVSSDIQPVLSDAGRVVTYPEVWPGVDVRYTLGAGGVKEDVVVKRRQDRASFPFLTNARSVAPPSAEEVDAGVPEGAVRVDAGAPGGALLIAPPVATDRAGLPVFGGVSGIQVVDRGVSEDRAVGVGRRLEVSASARWLAGLAEDQYPVALDPTIVVDGSSNWVQLAAYFTNYGVSCTQPPGPCSLFAGLDSNNWNYRTHISFNLHNTVWPLVIQNPAGAVVSARLKTVGAAIYAPVREFHAFHDMPSGQALNYLASNYMPYLGGAPLDGAGNGYIDFTGTFQQWRTEKQAGASKWDTPTLAIRGNESTFAKIHLGNTFIEVNFNRPPVMANMTPGTTVDINPEPVGSLSQNLSATISDPDIGDVVTRRFWLCELSPTYACSVSAWGSASSVSASSIRPVFWNRAYMWSIEATDGTQTAWSEQRYFSTVVPPASAPAWRGGDDPYSGFAGGVNLVTGNYFATQLDASVATVGPKLEIERSYNSLDPRVGRFGKGWSSLLDNRVENVTNGVVLHRADGRSEFYGVNPDGSVSPPPGVGSILWVAPGATSFTVTEPGGTVQTFDASGRLTLITDEMGHQLAITWVGTDPTKIESKPGGGAVARTLTLTSTAGKITSVKTDSVTGQGQLTWTYEYVGNNLTGVIDPEQAATPTVKTVYEYAGVNGQLSKWKNPGNLSFVANTEIELSYQADGRVAWRKDGANNLHSYNYATTPLSGESLAVTVTDPRSYTTVWGFDLSKRLVRRRSELSGGNNTRTWEYSITTGFLGRLNFEDPGHYETYVTDAKGNVTATTTVWDGEARTTYAAYNTVGNPTEIWDARSSSTSDTTYLSTKTYDAAGKRVTSETRAGLAGSIVYTYTTATSPGGGTPAGLLWTKVEPTRGAGTAASDRGTTTYTYNTKGDPLTVVDPLGKTTTFTYDEVGRPLTRTETGAGIPTGAVWTTSYDKLGRVKTVLEPSVTNVATSTARRRRTDTFYDNNGNIDRVEVVAVAGGGTTRVTKYTYDAADRQLSETVAHGTAIASTTAKAYDEMSNVITVTDPENRVFTTSYTPDNLPDVTTLAAYQPDPIFNPGTTQTLTVKDLDYDDSRRVMRETDAKGRVVESTYTHDKPKRKVLKNFAPRIGAAYDLVLEDNVYDKVGNLLSKGEGNEFVAPNRARTTVATYSPANLKLTEQVKNSDGNVERSTTWTYDAAGHQTTETRHALGLGGNDRVTRTLYTQEGLVDYREVENGAGAADDLKTSFTYDDRGNVLTTTDPDGGVVTTTYDAAGQKTSVKQPSVPTETNGGTPVSAQPEAKSGYNAFGELSHEVDPNGNTTQHAYDDQGREITITHPTYTPPGGTAVTPTESRTYDKVGNLTGSKDRRDKWTYYTFDKLNRNVKTDAPGTVAATRALSYTLFDEVGFTIKTIDPNGAVVTQTSDMMRRVRTRTQEIRQPTLRYATTTTDYDSVGNVTWVQDPELLITTRTVNTAGQTLSETDPNNKTAYTVYNAFGDVITQKDRTDRWVEFTYDTAGRQLTQSETGIAGGDYPHTTAFEYNKRSMRTKVTTAMGRVTTTNYDVAGRMTSVVRGFGTGDAATTSYFYDKAGNNTRFRDGRNNDTILTYQPWNLPATRRLPAATAGQAAANRTWTNSYDKAGLVTREAMPGSIRIDRTFDEAGRPLTEVGTGATGSRTFTYDVSGRLATVTHPTAAITISYDDRNLPLTVGGGSSTTTYAWDKAGKLTSRTDAAGSSTVTYDTAGRPQTQTDPVTGGTLRFWWDDAGRTTTTAFAPAGVNNWNDEAHRSIFYNGYGQPNAEYVDPASNKDPSGNATYQKYSYWDNDGLISGVDISGTSNPTDAGSHSFGYNSRGELNSWTKPGGTTLTYGYDAAGNRTSAAGVTFTYDNQNRLTSGGGKTYTWTDRGTLATVTGGGTVNSTFDVFGQNLTNGTVTLTYDGLGRIATRNSTAFKYEGTGLDPISEGTWTTSHTYAGTAMATKNATAGTARWTITNTHQDVVALLSPTSTATDNTIGYNPFGEVTGRTGSLAPTVGFQSDFTDPTNNEVWMGARHYRPTTATFTSQDSVTGKLESPISLNRYTYAHNNPLNSFDPDGHAPTTADYASLDRRLRRIDVSKYGDDAGAYMRDVAAAIGMYEAEEFAKVVKLVGGLGQDAILDAAKFRSADVVEPVKARGMFLASVAWQRRAKPGSKGKPHGPPAPSAPKAAPGPWVRTATTRTKDIADRPGRPGDRRYSIVPGTLREDVEFQNRNGCRGVDPILTRCEVTVGMVVTIHVEDPRYGIGWYQDYRFTVNRTATTVPIPLPGSGGGDPTAPGPNLKVSSVTCNGSWGRATWGDHNARPPSKSPSVGVLPGTKRLVERGACSQGIEDSSWITSRIESGLRIPMPWEGT